MSLLSVAQTTAASGQVTSSTGAQSSAALAAEQAMASFNEVLGEAVSFAGSGALPSLPGILQKAAMANANAAPSLAPSWHDGQNQTDAPDSFTTSQVSSNTQAAPTGPVAATSSDTATSQTGQTKSNSDTAQSTDQTQQQTVDATASTAQPVLEVLVGQMTQQVQVQQVTTAPSATQTAQTGTGAKDFGNQPTKTGPITDPLAQDLTDQGQKGAAPLGTAQSQGSSSGQNLSGQTNDQANQFGDLLAAQGTGTKTAQTTHQGTVNALAGTSGVQAQANDLAQSLNGTGAAIAVTVTTVAQAATNTQATTSDAADAAPAALAAGLQFSTVDPMGSGSGDPSGTGGQGQNGAADSLAGAAVTAGAAQTAAGNAEATSFNAALVAQISASSAADEPQAPTPTAMQGVQGAAGVNAPQATDKTTQAQAPQAPTPPRTPLQAQVLDQVSVQIDKQAKEGVDTIKVKLNPQELGHIEIKLEVASDGSVQATVTAENKDTLAMLQKDAPGLAKALSDAGLSTDAGSLSFNLQGGTDQQQQQFSGGSNGQNGNARAARGWASAGDESNDSVAASVAAQSSAGSLSAVDISV